MSRNLWFRLYDEVVDDPKVQTLPLILFRAWVNLMCVANKHGGQLPELKEIAYRLHVTESRAKDLLNALAAAGLFEQKEGLFYPHNWNGRQYKSDVSTDRVRQFRERQTKPEGNVSETPPETPQIQNRADTELKKESPPEIPKKSGPTLPPKDFEISDDMRDWANTEGFDNPLIQRETAAMLDHFRGNGKRKHDWPATWRNWLRNSRKFGGSHGNGQIKTNTAAVNLNAARDFVSRRLAETVRGHPADVREDSGGLPGAPGSVGG